MQNICRTCMSKEEEMISIFDQGKSPSINVMISAISSLEFLPSDDVMPSKMCIACFETLEMTYYFKKQVIRCNNSLQKRAKRKFPELLLVKEKEDKNRMAEEYFHSERNDKVILIDDEVSTIPTQNVFFNIDTPSSQCHEQLISMEKDPLAQSDVNSLNLEMPLSSEARDGDLPEERSSYVEDVNSHFEGTCTKSEEVDVMEHGVQFQENFEIIPEHILPINEVNVNGSCSNEYVPLTWLHANNGIYHQTQEVQQNSNEIGEECGNDSENPSTLRSFRRCHQDELNPNSPNEKQVRCPVGYPNGNVKVHDELHLRTAAEKPPTCQVCKVTFKSTTGLKRHIRVHSGKPLAKPHICLICGIAFQSVSQIKIHMRSHMPFKCQQCDASFTGSISLDNHIRSHTGEYPPKLHKCGVCGKQFLTPSHLNVHLGEHTGETPFKGFSYTPNSTPKSGLNHQMPQHPAEVMPKLQQCHVCGQSFEWPTHFNMHMRTHYAELNVRY